MATFSPGQEAARRLLEGRQRYTCLVGGTRSGKTFLIVRAIILRALKAEGSRHAILRFHANAARASIALDSLPNVVRICFPDTTIKARRQDGFFEFENGSRIWIGGLDDKDRVEKILGLEYSTVFLNEASQIPYASALVAFTRLAQVVPKLRQRAFVDLNPVGTSHWTNRLFGDKRDPVSLKPLKDPQAYARAFFNPADNKANLSRPFLASLANLPEKQRKRFFEGVYVDEVDGALWSYSDIDAHRCEPADIPEDRRAAVVVAVDPSGAAGRDDLGADEIGIIVAARGFDGDAYILDDLSCREAPVVWGRRAAVSLSQIPRRLHRRREQFRRRNGARDDPGGRPQRAGAARHGEPRQGGARRADLGALRARAGASRRPLRQARGSALRLFRRRLQRRRQPRPRRRGNLGADASVWPRRRDRHHRILPPRGGRRRRRVTPRSTSSEGRSMVDRSAGTRSWPLSPYQVDIRFDAATAGENGWFGPLAPMTPLAPPDVAGRQWDFPSGYNLATRVRNFEPVTFATLRGLADGYDLLRLVIETRKDQTARQSWSIAARDAAGRIRLPPTRGSPRRRDSSPSPTAAMASPTGCASCSRKSSSPTRRRCISGATGRGGSTR